MNARRHHLFLWMVAAFFLDGGMSALADRLGATQIMSDLGIAEANAARILNGEMVESDLAESSDRELGIALTFLVQQPITVVLDAFLSATDLKSDEHVGQAVRIHGSPIDFAALELPAAEAKRYLSVGPGDGLNLSAPEMQAFQKLTSSSAELTAKVREKLQSILFERYRAYADHGLEGLTPYARRDGTRDPAGELRSATRAAAVVQKYSPPLYQLLHTYPSGKPPQLEEAFYWLRSNLDDRPNYTLRHRMALPFNGGVALVERDFYVSHGYNVSQSISGIVPVPEGTIVFYSSRVSTDQVGGFGSAMKRGIGRGVMAKQLTQIFQRTRMSLEPAAMSPLPVAKTTSVAR